MSLEFSTIALNDIVSLVIDYRGKTPKKLGSDWSESGIRALSAKNIKTGQIIREDAIRYVDTELYYKWMKDEIKRNDILITSEAPFGEVFFWDSDEKIVLSQRLFGVRCDENKVDPKFIYFYMTSEMFQWELQSRATGTTVKGLRQPELLKCEIQLPNINYQRKISYILSNIEHKITVLKKLNKNLLQLSKVIFKNWFVEFEPFGGVQPEDWKICTLEDVCDLKAGGDKPNVVSDEITDTCIYPIYSNGLDKYGLYGYTDQAKIFEESVTVSARGTIGFVCLRHIPYVPIVRLVSIIPKKEFISAKYLYLFLDRLNIMGTGTTQQQLTIPDFKKTEILVPTLDVIESFTDYLKPIFEKIWIQEDEIKKLSKLRDTLLPKLMSGEIDVSKINCD